MRDSTLAKKSSCFFSISIWILLADMKAISMPEKKAENTKDSIIMIMDVSTFIVRYPFFFARTFSYSFFEKQTSLLKLQQKT